MAGSLQEAMHVPNVRLFVWFRVFFHARYYYPIFTLIFLDFGLTLEQFALLNVLWAITIVVAEVPSGALADIVGRKRLLVSGAVLMLLEMGVLLLAPINGGALMVTFFAVNRIASGLAEAMVSGADEALAYESLKEKGLEEAWPQVLERASRRMSAVMAFAMVFGAVLYDPGIMNGAFALLGLSWEVTQNDLIRVPIALTAVHGLGVLWLTLRMREPTGGKEQGQGFALVGAAFGNILKAAKWTLDHRFILFVILAGLILDSVARHFVILLSEYYRLIHLPEWSLGFLGAAAAALGVLWAGLARWLATTRTPLANLLILSASITVGLIGISFVIPYVGLLFVPLVTLMFGVVPFLQSHYINREVDSSMRATILSFRGLAVNLGLGIASLLYTLLVASLKTGYTDLDAEALQTAVFIDALAWFPGYYLVLLALVLIGGRIFIRKRGKAVKAG